MKFVTRVVAAAAAALTISSIAGAQSFNYSTTGQFTSAGPTCNNAVAAAVVTCASPTPGGLALTFNGVLPSAFGYNSGSQITLGTFTPSGAGSADLAGGIVNFTLYINQITPSLGTGSTVGTLSGQFTLGVGPSFSNVVWTPTQNVQIAPVNYSLIFDQGSNGIRIGAEFPTSIQAVAVSVPEPSTYALMAAGLASLGMVARRRRTTV